MFSYPYTWLHVHVTFLLTAGACLSWVCHRSQSSKTSLFTGFLSRHCRMGWKITEPCICSSTKSTWIDKAGQLSMSPYTQTIILIQRSWIVITLFWYLPHTIYVLACLDQSQTRTYNVNNIPVHVQGNWASCMHSNIHVGLQPMTEYFESNSSCSNDIKYISHLMLHMHMHFIDNKHLNNINWAGWQLR